MLILLLKAFAMVLASLPPDLCIALHYQGVQPGGGEVDPYKFPPLSSVSILEDRGGERSDLEYSPPSLGFQDLITFCFHFDLFLIWGKWDWCFIYETDTKFPFKIHLSNRDAKMSKNFVGGLRMTQD